MTVVTNIPVITLMLPPRDGRSSAVREYYLRMYGIAMLPLLMGIPLVAVDVSVVPPQAQSALAEGSGAPVMIEQPPTKVDSVRSWGQATAPYRVDLVLNINCAHCADVLGPTEVALAPLVERGTIRLVTRFRLGPHPEAARDLLEHLLAAESPAQFRVLTRLMVGTPEGRDWAMMRARWSEVLDLAPLEARCVALHADLCQTLDADGVFLTKQAIRQIPCLLVTDWRSGREIARTAGESFDPTVVTSQSFGP